MEGVAFSLRDTLRIFDEMQLPVHTVRLGGGGARSALWRQIQADVFGRSVETVTAEEGAAYGAAILAGVGGRVWPTVDAACEALVHTNHVTRPDAHAVARMNERYEEYRRMYPALRRIQHRDDCREADA
jgi:xylulokinase